MPPAIFSAKDVDPLFRSSENHPTLYQGRDHNPDGFAHALARHYLITNTGLMNRRENEGRDGAIAFFSALL